jgi:hypothetical protein
MNPTKIASAQLRADLSRRPATIPCDENLEANSGGGEKLKAGTEATTRSILELSAAAIPCPEVFIADAEWLAKRIAIR